jgi:hypothetical protein
MKKMCQESDQPMNRPNFLGKVKAGESEAEVMRPAAQRRWRWRLEGWGRPFDCKAFRIPAGIMHLPCQIGFVGKTKPCCKLIRQPCDVAKMPWWGLPSACLAIGCLGRLQPCAQRISCSLRDGIPSGAWSFFIPNLHVS